ncbi:MAG: carboxylating nicotinate-nucleotide diphosphorylase [Ignavibacteriae bacterium]|nr:carboxylating nicotinate-nucleotide diphosphorylase [Ignavibacteria bacterium]MBI3364698.1 carboxylating nicotinate-nucleotide diphosphorylase [Ignavibacteriota bacterium]
MSNHDQHNALHDIAHDSRVSRIVVEALMEDLGMGDVTTDAAIPRDLTGYAGLLAKESGIIAGLDVAALVFSAVDVDVRMTHLLQDGAMVDAQTTIARLDGPVASILKAERTALNILQRMSGIATLTRMFVDAIAGTRATITDTRKTAPGLRLLDKRAVQIGGGVNHRFGLDDMVLIKDNHIAAAGGITAAVERCRAFMAERNYHLKIEVETKTFEEVKEALAVKGIHRIMLDNFPLDMMRDAVQLINHAVEVEASGNVSLATVRATAETGVDFISVGALTHSPKALDISLNVKATKSSGRGKS